MFSKNSVRLFFSLLVLFFCGSCGVTDVPGKIDVTNKKIDDMSSKMDLTNDAIHRQTLAVALDHLLAPENTKYLTPVPTAMMPWAQAFAQEMRESEFMQLASLYIAEINEVGPDESRKDPKTGNFSNALKASVDHDKLVKLYAIMAIAGFASQNLIQTSVETEVIHGGEFADTVYAALYCRAKFIKDILLTETLLASPLDNPGKISKAIERAEYLDYIATQPFVAKIGVEIYGMLTPETNLSDRVDPNMSVDIWLKINQAFDHELEPRFMTGLKSDPNLIQLRDRVEAACRRMKIWNGTRCAQN